MSTARPSGSAPPPAAEDLARVAEAVRAAWGVDSWRPRRVVAELARGDWRPVRGLVQRHALSRRAVTDLLRQLTPWVEADGERARLRPEAAEAVRAAFADPAGTGGRPSWDAALAAAGDEGTAVAAMRELMAGRPAPDQNLDHLPATPQTAVARARFLLDNYDLSRAGLLFLGDHDLTSLAVLGQRPDLAVAVVDVDERILAYVDRVARARGWSVRTVFADLRVDLPRSLAGRFDLVFSDPPYTPQGVRLFWPAASPASAGTSSAGCCSATASASTIPGWR